MKQRLKLPPYGRTLFFQRRRGQHPQKVWVIYGADWSRRPEDHPCLCVDESYAPGQHDWSLLAGVPAHVVWRSGERVYELVAEVARFAAPVVVHWFSGEYGPCQEHANNFLDPRVNPEIAQLWPESVAQDYCDRDAAWYVASIEDTLGNQAGACR